MNGRRLLQQTFGVTLVVLLLAGCGGLLAKPTPVPTATPYPTYTPVPTMTPYPTYTPLPTPTTTGVDEWLEGHFWSIKVIDVHTETELDGVHPTDHLTEMHSIAGIDFELVDDADEQYRIVGMIYESGTYDSHGAGAEFQKGKWQITRSSGTGDKAYRLVFDIPSSAAGLKLWFRNFPLIDLDLELP